MGNKYSSAIRRIWAKGIDEVVIHPPADLVFPANLAFNSNTQMFIFPQEWINKDSIVKVHSLGLFSNFADGLVYEASNASLQMVITAIGAINQKLVSSHGACVSTTKQIVGNVADHFDTDLADGIFISIMAGWPSLDETYVYRVDGAPPDNFHANITSYPIVTTSGSPVYKLQTMSGSAGASKPFDIRELNVMHPCEYIINPQGVSSTPYTSLILLLGYRCADISFLTKSIDTAYDGDTAVFDVAADIEITGA